MAELDLMHAPVTYALLILNLIISGYAFFVDQGIIHRYMLHVRAVVEFRQYYRIISCGFLHANPFHFLFNMITLFFFGRPIEKTIGSFKFFILYAGALVVAHLIALYVKRKDPEYAAIGASGAISGVVFSFCLFAPFSPIYVFFIPIGIPAILFAVIYMLYSIYAMDNTEIGGRVAHEAHLGGALGGVLLTIFLEPRALDSFLIQLNQVV